MRVLYNSLILFVLIVFMSVIFWKVWSDSKNIQEKLEALDIIIAPILEKESSKSIQDYLQTKKNFLEKFYTDRASTVDTLLAIMGILLALFGLIIPILAKMLTEERLKKLEKLEKKNADNLKETESLKSQMDKQFAELEELKRELEEKLEKN